MAPQKSYGELLAPEFPGNHNPMIRGAGLDPPKEAKKMAEAKDGCVKAAKGPILPPAAEAGLSETQERREALKMVARVGKPAPDFEASAYVDGGFRNVTLSDYKGKWVVLCFYPGDFTFV
jgi:hypothetical protein